MLTTRKTASGLFGGLWVAANLLAAAFAAPSAFGYEEDGADERRDRCLAVLRNVLRDEPRWVKVHAAEYLLGLDYPEGVGETFQKELADHERESQYRVGIWRVLARAAREPRQAAPWVGRIRDVFLDRSAPDRLHALETLAKLGYKVPKDLLAPFLDAAKESTGAMTVFGRWVLLNTGLPGAEDRLTELLESSDLETRRLGGYVFGRLRSVSPEAAKRLAAATEQEPEDSPARVMLVAAAAVHAPRETRDRFKTQLVEYARKGTTEEQIRAVDALASAAGQADLPVLVDLLAHSDADLRATAAWALLRLDRRAPHRLGVLDWVVIAVYGLGMLAVGWYYWRRTHTSEDYLLGGRTMKSLPVGLSLFATLFSTISYLAWPGEVVKYGPMFLSVCVAYPLVAVVAGRFLIPHIMKLKITSAYELLEVRLGLAVRLLGSTLFLLLRVLWMSVIVYATVGTVLMPLLGFDPSLTPWVCTVLGGITLIYTAMGGLRAVVWTDVLQSLILFAGAAVAIAAVTVYLGGVSAWWPTRWESHWTEPVFYDPNIRVTFLGAVLATFTWYISTAGSDQMAVQRYLATRDVQSARKVLNTSLVANTLVFLLLAALGLALLAYFQTNPHLVPDGQTIYDNADQLFTRFIAVGLPPGFAGLVVAGLLAAAMSSLSAGINASCSVVIADFIDRFGLRRQPTSPTEGGGAWLERCVSVVIGALMVVLSSYVGAVHGNLLEIAYKVVNLLSAPLFGLFCMAMFVPWATGFGTLVGAAAGLAVVVAINFWQELFGTQGISFLWAMPLSFLVQMAVGMVASLLPAGRRKGPAGLTSKTQIVLLAALVGLTTAGHSAAASGDPAPNWPRFHGPKGDNISTEAGLLKQWPEQGPKLLWTTKGIGHGFVGVTIADGMIYTAGDVGGDLVIFALDMDGRIQWQVKNGAACTESGPAGARGAPTIDGDRLYHENAHEEIVCLEAKTGRKLWDVNLAARYQGKRDGFGRAESLLIDGDRVICSPGGPVAMAALDKKTGQTIWKSSSAGEPAGYVSPNPVECQGLRILLTMASRSLIGVNADTGDLLWKFEHFTPRYVANCVTPIYHDGHVFISGGYGLGSVLLKINVQGGKAAVEPVWRSKDLDNRHGGVILWEGHLYGAAQKNNNAKWICLDWKTGRMTYADRGVGEGSLTCADGLLYTLSEQRKVGLVRPTPTKHELISQFKIPEGGEGPSWAHPVVCGGRLYIRHGERLYAYEVRAKH